MRAAVEETRLSNRGHLEKTQARKTRECGENIKTLAVTWQSRGLRKNPARKMLRRMSVANRQVWKDRKLEMVGGGNG